MNSNCKALLFNQGLNAQIAVSPTPLNAVANLVNESASEVLHINGATATIELSWQQAISLGGVCLWQTNLTVNAQVIVKLKLAGDLIATVNLESSLSVLPLMPRNYWFCFFDNTLIDSIEIEIEDNDNSFGYLELGYLFCGYAFSPKYNFDYGYQVLWADDSKQERHYGGSVSTDNLPNYRTATITLSHIDNAERDSFSELLIYVSVKHLVFVSLHPVAEDKRRVEYAFMAKFRTPPADYTIPRYNNQTLKWDLIESIGGNGTPLGVTFTGSCDPALILGFMSQIEQLNQLVAQLQSDNASLQTQLNQSQVVVDTLPQQVVDLQTDLTECIAEKDSLDDNLVLCQQEKAVLETENADLTQNLADSEAENTQLQTNLTDCQAEKADLVAENGQLETNLGVCQAEKQAIIEGFETYKQSFLGVEFGSVQFSVLDISLNIEFIGYSLTGLSVD